MIGVRCFVALFHVVDLFVIKCFCRLRLTLVWRRHKLSFFPGVIQSSKLRIRVPVLLKLDSTLFWREVRCLRISASSRFPPGLIGAEAVRFFAAKGYRVLGIDNDMRQEFFGADASTEWSRRDLETKLPTYTHFKLDIRDREGIEGLSINMGQTSRL